MKSCPTCNRVYDDSLSFCLDDGSALLDGSADAETIIRRAPNVEPTTTGSNSWKYAFLILVPILIAAFVVAIFISSKANQANDPKQVQSSSGSPIAGAPVNTAQNVNVNIENQNTGTINANSTPEEKPAPTKRKDKPKFSDYPTTETFQGRNAPLVLASSRDKQFKTFLKESATKRPNFAGHYILASVGCGTECAQAAVIDVTSGLVYWFPETVNFGLWGETGDEEIIKYRADSKLLSFYTLKEDESTDYGYLRYYVFENNRFYLVYSVKAPTTF